MDKTQEHLETLKDIRNIMDRSSRFISLSGLSGVFAGIFALAGAFVANYKLDISFTRYDYFEGHSTRWMKFDDFIWFFVTDAGLVLVASLLVATFFTVRNSRKKGIAIWGSTSKRLMLNMMIPLIAGGSFCLALLYHGFWGLVAPATLVFYGLALLNASKYTLNDIRYLGVSEIALGVVGSFFVGYGLLFWSIGFGVLHIVYGAVMYFKYERG
ncbi:MAG TPA: hypothetical protein VI112_08335 [Bacteroidia bacterium]